MGHPELNPVRTLPKPAQPQLVLGTVQFGMPYGIHNPQQVVPEAAVQRILTLAGQHHVYRLDTAAGYGESEAVLGRCLDALPLPPAPWQIITKFPAIAEDTIPPHTAAQFIQSFSRSLQKLNIAPSNPDPSTRQLQAVLFHQSEDLLKPGAKALLQHLRDENIPLGISVYDPGVLIQILERFGDFWHPTVVQFPLNILDQRFLHAQWQATPLLEKLAQLGITLDARSIFLQGILLHPTELPEKLQSTPAFLEHMARYHHTLQELGWTPLQAALSFVQTCKALSGVVVGVYTAQQWREILSCWETLTLNSAVSHNIPCIETLMSFRYDTVPGSKTLLQPRYWHAPQ